MSQRRPIRTLLLWLLIPVLGACELPGQKPSDPVGDLQKKMMEQNTELARACMQGGGTWDRFSHECRHDAAAQAACIAADGFWSAVSHFCIGAKTPTIPTTPRVTLAPSYTVPSTGAWMSPGPLATYDNSPSGFPTLPPSLFATTVPAPTTTRPFASWQARDEEAARIKCIAEGGEWDYGTPGWCY
jgi:hypothetical protein